MYPLQSRNSTIKKTTLKTVTRHQFLTRKSIHKVIGTTPGWSVGSSVEWCKLSFLAKRRAARFIIWSRAKRACISASRVSQASQGQRDFLFRVCLVSALTSSKVVTPKCIMGFKATDCHRLQSSGLYS